MSNRYKGGVISATPPTTTGGESGTASGAWTLEQQMQLQAAGLWPAQPTGPYIEDVFSTYLYTGNGTSQTITNGIDLAGKGGATWLKVRNLAGEEPTLFSTDTTYGIGTNTNGFNTRLNSSFWTTTSSGFNLLNSNPVINENLKNYVSWTFRQQPKFFDVVTYTGNGTARSIAHSLGSAPGCVIIKSTSGTGLWAVWHRSGTQENRYSAFLNLTDAYSNQGSSYWGTPLTDAPNMNASTFSVGTVADVNGNGVSYVAYLFAHDAGGFGLTGTDNVISCGSFTPDAGGSATVTLGWEPQWILVKVSGTTGNWTVIDNMRDWSLGGNSTGSNDYLRPNTNGAELEAGTGFPTATGFFIDGVVAASQPHIYIAIRRGPMKVPTSGTSVFAPVTVTGNDTDNRQVSSGFVTDFVIGNRRTGAFGANGAFVDRLRGPTPILYSYATDAEATGNVGVRSFAVQDGMTVGGNTAYSFNYSGQTYVNWMFKRAPGFFDEVCYTGTGTGTTVTHNLGVTPELMIIKNRSNAANWAVWQKDISPSTAILFLNNTATQSTGYVGSVTATTFAFLSPNVITSANGDAYVAYLFATCAGVSKVGSYTGTATTLQVDCGFTAGSRFVLIKRTDSTGDWYVWDSARGIVAGNDPYLLMNSSAVEVTGTDYVDTYNAGFEISSTAPAAINANGGTYLFLAIA